MRKLFVMVIASVCLAGLLGGCDGGPSLTIKNESSYELTNVDYRYNSYDVTALFGPIAPGASVTMGVNSSSDKKYISFKIGLAPTQYRTSDSFTIGSTEQRTYTVYNSTSIGPTGTNKYNSLASFGGTITGPKPTLTIKNESSHQLTHVTWNNTSFTKDSDSLNPGQNTRMDIQAGSGYVRFRPKSNPFNLRTNELLVVASEGNTEFVILDNTAIIKEIDNSTGTLNFVASVILKIGETGPGGGTIFFASGGQFREVSEELGLYNAENAIATAGKHSGGSFSDWRIPDSGDLTLLYDNLHKQGLGGFSDAKYWGGRISQGNTSSHFIDFATGSLHSAGTNNTSIDGIDTSTSSNMRVRAVRTFLVN